MRTGKHMLGRKHAEKTIKKMRNGSRKGENSPTWKGSRAGYYAIHIWANNTFGRLQNCEDCKSSKEKKYEWANISKKYLRKRDDWKRLCTKCHRKYDGHQAKMWATRKLNKRT